MIDKKVISKKIREFIAKDTRIDPASFFDYSNLFELENFDSLKIVTLVAFIEKEFRLKLDFQDLNEENLGSVRAIVNLLIRKSKKAKY